MGRVFLKYLDGSNVYLCANCKCHLSLHDEIISTNFHGRQGKAYLFNKTVNVVTGPSEERSLITGIHVVRDIYCTNCHIILGWKYDDAHEDTQKYKIGKFVLEKARLRKESTSSEMVDLNASSSESDDDDDDEEEEEEEIDDDDDDDE